MKGGANMVNSIQTYTSLYRVAQQMNISSLSSLSPVSYPFATDNSTFSSLTSVSSNYNAKDLAEYLTNLDTDMDSLLKSASSLNKMLDSLDNLKVADVSEKDVLTASSNYGAKTASYEIDVQELATEQVNQSDKLSATERNSFTQGENTIAITQNGKTTNVSFNVLSGDNNAQSLARAARAINQSDAGVTASVEIDKENNAYLTITADKTGENNAFSIEDATGDFADKANLNNIKEQAQNARYSVNGNEYEATKNYISLDLGRVNATIKSEGKSTITVSSNPDDVVSSVERFVKDYNEAVSSLSSGRVQNSAINSLTSGFSLNASARRNLAEIGITQNNYTGKMSVDKEKLASAIAQNPDRVEALLSKETGGLTSKAENAVKRVENTPKTTFVSNSYLNGEDYGYISGQNSIYRNYASLGLMMNMLL